MRTIGFILLLLALLFAPAVAQERPSCSTCKGGGRVDCPAAEKCTGKTCEDCAGAGKLDCPDCRPRALAKVLASLYAGDLTTLQRERLLARSKGLLVDADLEAIDVATAEDGSFVVTAAAGGTLVTLRAPESHKAFLRGLSKGKAFRATGRIESLRNETVVLKDCVLTPPQKREAPKELNFDDLCRRTNAANAATDPVQRDARLLEIRTELDGKTMRCEGLVDHVTPATAEKPATVRLRSRGDAFFTTVLFRLADDAATIAKLKTGVWIRFEAFVQIVPGKLPALVNARLR